MRVTQPLATRITVMVTRVTRTRAMSMYLTTMLATDITAAPVITATPLVVTAQIPMEQPQYRLTRTSAVTQRTVLTPTIRPEAEHVTVVVDTSPVTVELILVVPQDASQFTTAQFIPARIARRVILAVVEPATRPVQRTRGRRATKRVIKHVTKRATRLALTTTILYH